MFLRKSLADSPRAAGAGGPLRRIAPASLKNYPSRGSAVLLQHRCNRVAADQFLARYIARQFAKTEDKTPFLADGTSTVSAKRMPPKKCPVDFYTPAVFAQNRLPTSRSNGWRTICAFGHVQPCFIGLSCGSLGHAVLHGLSIQRNFTPPATVPRRSVMLSKPLIFG